MLKVDRYLSECHNKKWINKSNYSKLNIHVHDCMHKVMLVYGRKASSNTTRMFVKLQKVKRSVDNNKSLCSNTAMTKQIKLL